MKKIKNPYIGLEEQGYNCFACCPTNPCGLKMSFYEDGDDIVSLWNPGENYQSWINTLHGGIQATLTCNGKVCSMSEITYFCFPKDVAERDFLFKECVLEDE